jgi:hypothetical protein
MTMHRVEGDLKIARALEDTVERARHYGAMARDALDLFPASPWKHALRDAVEFAISRAYWALSAAFWKSGRAIAGALISVATGALFPGNWERTGKNRAPLSRFVTKRRFVSGACAKTPVRAEQEGSRERVRP